MKTFKAMWLLEWKLVFRNWKSLILTLGMPVTFFLLFSSISNLGDLSPEQVNAVYRQVLMAMTASSVLSLAIYTFPYALQEDRIGNRLRSIEHSPVPLWQYYAVKMLRLLCYFALSVVIVFGVGYVSKGISMSAGDWAMSTLFLLIGAVAILPIGLLLSYIQSTETLSVLTNILYMGLAILGGLWYPMQSFPHWLQMIVKLTPTHHYLNLFISYYAGQFSWLSLAILAGYAIIILGFAVLINKRKGRES
ncbi:ABC transporter permease [Streptococcus sp. DD13]|uniref:ABC transporter permease n=1 Tax=Streptococcus sp. DD13 TaxID=1777881 RepID=UPI000799A8EB|nr:ABC transporter permease [Streptococcus sp. DD13]KXT79232.1 ABC transporter permease protein [Streptococcus sp. DD13]